MLPVRAHMALTLATQLYAHPGRRAADAREHLGMSETRFWQYVGALLDDPDAWAERPLEVKRLRRLRELRAERRSVKRRA